MTSLQLIFSLRKKITEIFGISIEFAHVNYNQSDDSGQMEILWYKGKNIAIMREISNRYKVDFIIFNKPYDIDNLYKEIESFIPSIRLDLLSESFKNWEEEFNQVPGPWRKKRIEEDERIKSFDSATTPKEKRLQDVQERNLLAETWGKSVASRILRKRRTQGKSVDNEQLLKIIDDIFLRNPQAVRDAKTDPNAIHFLIGKVMKETKGHADHVISKELIEKKLLPFDNKELNGFGGT